MMTAAALARSMSFATLNTALGPLIGRSLHGRRFHSKDPSRAHSISSIRSIAQAVALLFARAVPVLACAVYCTGLPVHSSLYAALRKRTDLRKACACMPCASARCPCSHTQDLPCLGHHRRACELYVSSVAGIARFTARPLRSAHQRARPHSPICSYPLVYLHAPSPSCHNHAVVAPRLRQPSQHR